jgi:Holliday junction resolvase RusA-like endonuclease
MSGSIGSEGRLMLTSERRSLTFRVVGTAIPKGSLKPFLPKGWHYPIVRHDNPKTTGWHQLVRAEAQRLAPDVLFAGPIAVAMVFRLPRPASLPKRRQHHTNKPDLDKLARGVLDALTGVLYADDKAVVDLHVKKLYAPPASPPSACITVLEAAFPELRQSSLMLALESERSDDPCRI